MNTKKTYLFVLAICCVALPRLVLCLGLPATDEGFYAFYAQLVYSFLSNDFALPNWGPIMLYSTLLSWVFAFNVNHFIFLRLCDLLFATFFGYLFARLIDSLSSSVWITGLVVFSFLPTLNDPVFIQNGFKNSFFVAMIPLLLALRLILEGSSKGFRKSFVIGLLLGASVLLRESLIFWLLSILILIFARSGLLISTVTLIGSVFSVFLVSSAVVFYRDGSFVRLFMNYKSFGKIFSALEHERFNFFYKALSEAVSTAWFPTFLGIFFIVFHFLRFILGHEIRKPFVLIFYFMLVLVSFVEPFLKIGFPYHFSFALLGLGALSAIGLESLFCSIRRGWVKGLVIVLLFVGSSFSLRGLFTRVYRSADFSFVFVQSFVSPAWTDDQINRSTYLVVAKIINSLKEPGDSLLVSGFMYPLYPLTGLLPPSLESANLTSSFIELDGNKNHLRRLIMSNPPDIMFLSDREDWPGKSEIKSVVDGTGLFFEAFKVPPSSDRSYGSFSGTIYIRVSAN